MITLWIPLFAIILVGGIALIGYAMTPAEEES